MEDLNKAFDFILERYVEAVEEGTREVVEELISLIQDLDYAFVGGIAVSLYYSGARPVSPGDVELKILRDDADKIVERLTENSWRLLRKNQFMDSIWFVFSKGGQNLDVGIAQKKWDIEGIERSRIFLYKGIKVKVLPPEYLIVSKLFVGRGKDFNDVVALLKSGKVNEKLADRLVKRFIPDLWDDYELMKEYARTFDDEDFKRIFE